MAYCPKDLKPCSDDLCYGGGCLVLDGAAMYYPCAGCNKLVSDDDNDMCACDEDFDEQSD